MALVTSRSPCSFVSGLVAFYYGEDAAVSGDAELQAWVMDIFTNGFLGRTSSGRVALPPQDVSRGGGGDQDRLLMVFAVPSALPGVPSSLRTVAELSKFLTMVVFTCSVQHAAVNNGQVGQGTSGPAAPRHCPECP